MTTQAPLLTLENLTLSIKKAPKESSFILKGVTLTIHKGEVVALVGPSGSGKSLTAMAVLGLLPEALEIIGGDIVFAEKSMTRMRAEELRKIRGKDIGMIFQDPLSHLNPTMCVGKQIAETLCFHKGLSYNEAKLEAYHLLEDVGIPTPRERYNFYPFQLSGGQLQRVMIASALACKPSLLLADEPTTALDPETQIQILELIKSLVKKYKMSLLFITHDLRVANLIADRIAVMDDGIIVEAAPKDMFLASPQHPKSQALVAQYRRRYRE